MWSVTWPYSACLCLFVHKGSWCELSHNRLSLWELTLCYNISNCNHTWGQSFKMVRWSTRPAIVPQINLSARLVFVTKKNIKVCCVPLRWVEDKSVWLHPVLSLHRNGVQNQSRSAIGSSTGYEGWLELETAEPPHQQHVRGCRSHNSAATALVCGHTYDVQVAWCIQCVNRQQACKSPKQARMVRSILDCSLQIVGICEVAEYSAHEFLHASSHSNGVSELTCCLAKPPDSGDHSSWICFVRLLLKHV